MTKAIRKKMREAADKIRAEEKEVVGIYGPSLLRKAYRAWRIKRAWEDRHVVPRDEERDDG